MITESSPRRRRWVLLGVPTSAGAHHAGQEQAPEALRRHGLSSAAGLRVPTSRTVGTWPARSGHPSPPAGAPATSTPCCDDADALAARPDLVHASDAELWADPDGVASRAPAAVVAARAR